MKKNSLLISIGVLSISLAVIGSTNQANNREDVKETFVMQENIVLKSLEDEINNKKVEKIRQEIKDKEEAQRKEEQRQKEIQEKKEREVRLQKEKVIRSQNKSAISNVRTTHYCLCKKCTGKSPGDNYWGISKSGIDLTKNPYVVAANPNVYSQKSIIYLKGLGYRVVGDTGTYLKTEKGKHTIDVYIGETNNHPRAMKLGVKGREVIRIQDSKGNIQNTVIDVFGEEEANSSHARESGRFLGIIK